MLKFGKSVPYIPDPVRSRPHISQKDKERAATVPPKPVPLHCKPWMDGQSVGWTLFYGFMTPVTITGTDEGGIEVTGLNQLARETNQARIIDQFASGYFGIGTGYTLMTPPGMHSLIIPASNPPPGLKALTGIIETDWYPRQLFLVFHTPSSGIEIHLDHKIPLARVVVVPRQEQWEAQPMSEEEIQSMQEMEDKYLQEERTTSTAWTADTGDTFTHLYKIWSRRNRRQEGTD